MALSARMLRRPPEPVHQAALPDVKLTEVPAGPCEGGLLTPAAVAGRLGCTEKVLERWRGTGDGPRFVRLTRKTIRYRPEDLVDFVTARVVTSTAA